LTAEAALIAPPLLTILRLPTAMQTVPEESQTIELIAVEFPGCGEAELVGHAFGVPDCAFASDPVSRNSPAAIMPQSPRSPYILVTPPPLTIF
jgi:hypothetical protein